MTTTPEDIAKASMELEIAAPRKQFNPKKIKETLEQCDKLIANYHKQIATMGELKRALVHECTKHFDDPEVRAAYIDIKLADLAARGVTVDERSRLKHIDASKRARMLQWDHELERVASEIKRAREYIVGQQEQGQP